MDDRLSVLAGGGISRPEPTSFPAAIEIVEAIVDLVLPAEGPGAGAQALIHRDHPARSSPGDHVRFETLLDVLEETIDPDLNVLGFVDLLTRPGPLRRSCSPCPVRQRPLSSRSPRQSRTCLRRSAGLKS